MSLEQRWLLRCDEPRCRRSQEGDDADQLRQEVLGYGWIQTADGDYFCKDHQEGRVAGCWHKSRGPWLCQLDAGHSGRHEWRERYIGAGARANDTYWWLDENSNWQLGRTPT